MLIVNEDSINKYTHIILDEVHERDMETDLIILLLKINLLGGYKGKVSLFFLKLLVLNAIKIF
jgi:HrpA-like RNA helicase